MCISKRKKKIIIAHIYIYICVGVYKYNMGFVFCFLLFFLWGGAQITICVCRGGGHEKKVGNHCSIGSSSVIIYERL